jgi:hypothetical protein
LGVKKESNEKKQNSILDWFAAIHNFNMLAFSFVCLLGLIHSTIDAWRVIFFFNIRKLLLTMFGVMLTV